MDNLIVIYENLVDQGFGLAASSTAGSTSLANLRNNTKSAVWRSTSTSATFLFTVPGLNVTAVALPFCNLTASATIRIRGWSTAPTLSGISVVGGTSVWDSGTIDACPWNTYLHNGSSSTPSGVSIYSYGGGKHARAYVPNVVVVNAVTIELVDSSNISGYIEASRLVVGNYWSPRFNTSFGISKEVINLSKHERTEAGDLITTTLPQFDKLTFDLKYMDTSDRAEFLKIIKTNGLSIPMFVSLFPNDVDPTKERDYQVFGKFSSLSPVLHPIHSMYSSQIVIEEI